MKGEIWKNIKKYEGLYQVSNMGRVKSLNYRKTGKERILKGVDYGQGYLYVSLIKDGKVEQCRINRLVAQAFLDNPEGYTDVNHRDENKQNNCVENLEWCSRSYNINYGTRNKKASEKLKGKKHSEEHIKKISEKLKGRKQSEEHIKKRSKPVFSVDKESGLIMWWQSASEAGRVLGIAPTHITKCCKGKYKSAGGHVWFYAEDNE